MLILRFLILVSSLLLATAGASGQSSEVAVLSGLASPSSTLATTEAHPFDFSRKQIYFTAVLDERPVHLILDTGMPGLVLNDRGDGAREATFTGEALGGAVRMATRRVRSLRMAGRDHGRQWAHTLDLSAVESRTERPVDGYVGYELLRNAELRIDYDEQTFQLLRPERRPTHNGAPPRHELKFTYVGHLPVVTLRVGNRKLRFAIDTGASVNLLDAAAGVRTVATDRSVNLQGLDGAAGDRPFVLLPDLSDLAPTETARSFATLDLSHLQTPNAPPIHGILGSDFLAGYTVGVDYRRRRVLLW